MILPQRTAFPPGPICLPPYCMRLPSRPKLVLPPRQWLRVIMDRGDEAGAKEKSTWPAILKMRTNERSLHGRGHGFTAWRAPGQ
jgi:hypothetical protein